MASVFAYVLSAVLGYIFGSFPTGYFAGKLWNVDVRKHGSGRTGGTNVLRTAGWRAFAITVVGDILKGMAPVIASRLLFPDLHVAHGLAMWGVLIGHNWSIWIAALAKPNSPSSSALRPSGWIHQIAARGRGGAGVAPTTGAALALFPPAVLLIAPVAILVLIVTRYASVASLTAASLFPIVILFFAFQGTAPWSYFVLSIIIAVTIILVHIPNIRRLRSGTERRFGHRVEERSRDSQPSGDV